MIKNSMATTDLKTLGLVRNRTMSLNDASFKTVKKARLSCHTRSCIFIPYVVWKIYKHFQIFVENLPQTG